MNSHSGRRLARISAIGALVAALVAALGLAGCGRKAGLDPPPTAGIVSPTGVSPTSASPTGLPPIEPVSDAGRRTARTVGPRKEHFLDWLID